MFQFIFASSSYPYLLLCLDLPYFPSPCSVSVSSVLWFSGFWPLHGYWTAFWIFVIFCTSAPLGLTTWLLNSCVLDFALYWPLPIKCLLCRVQQNCWCVLAFESFPQAWEPRHHCFQEANTQHLNLGIQSKFSICLLNELHLPLFFACNSCENVVSRGSRPTEWI